MSRIKNSFLKEVTVDDVMKELRADNYFEKTHREMFACVKDTLACKQLQEVALKQLMNTLTNTPKMSLEEKKIQINRIGSLASQLASSIFKTVSGRLEQEATIVAKRTLIKLLDKSSGKSESTGSKRKLNDTFEISQKTNKQNKKRKDSDMEAGMSLDGISDKSVSSVHTSDLSSFDDEIVVSSEDEKGEKKEKRISFKTANKAYFDDGFSAICNVIAHQNSNANGASKASKTAKQSLPDCSKNLGDSKSISPRPKRERKPNSKYSPEELY